MTGSLRPIAQWLTQPDGHHGLHLLENEGWVWHSYERLAADSFEAASRIAELTTEGDRVAIDASHLYAAATCFWGAIVADRIPLILASPQRFAGFSDTRRSSILRSSGARLFITANGANELVMDLVTDTDISKDGRHDGDLVALQYSSGSTNEPKGIEVSWASLTANAAMIESWLGLGNEESWASWLPLNHDMGLLGFFIIPFLRQDDLALMHPQQFIRRPTRWLETISRFNATIAGSPPMGYELVTRVRSTDKEPNLDSWRVAICGAQPLPAQVLREFVRKHVTSGLRSTALCPGYGLAECTLAVTGRRPWDVEAFAAILEPSGALAPGDHVRIADIRPVTDFETTPQVLAHSLVSCGRAMEGLTVQVIGEDGRVLPDATLGEISVAGPSVSPGYWGGERFFGHYSTGDVGFLIDGELYVVGRIADRIKVRGVTVYAEEIERTLRAHLGIVSESLIVIPSLTSSIQNITVVYESRSRSHIDHEYVTRLLESILGREIPIDIMPVPHGWIPRTTSGKVRRHDAWKALISDHRLQTREPFRTS